MGQWIVPATLVLIAAGVWFWQAQLWQQAQAGIRTAQAAEKEARLDAAEKACSQAVQRANKLWWGRTPALAVARFHLARIHFQQQRFEQAEQSANIAFRQVQRLGGASPVTTSLICLMAQIWKKLDKDLSANAFFQLALKLLRAQEGGESLKVGLALHEFGVTLDRIGLPEKAIPVFEECIPIFEKHLGPDHKEVAAALLNLGKAQSRIDCFVGAEQSYRRALAIREATLGSEDPEVAQVLNNLSVNYKRQDRFPEALACLSRALAIRETKLGPNHPDVGLILNNLANVLRLQKKYDEAEAAVTRALAILENPPHKSLPTVLDCFASLRAAQGRYEEADQLYTRCIQIHEKRASFNLIEFAETCERYASVLYKLQKEKQADALLEHVGQIRGAREKLLV